MFLAGLVVVLLSLPAPGAALPDSIKSHRTITPVFSQLVTFEYPRGFKGAFENTTPSNYIQEHVPEGQTKDSWTQMLTLTGAKGVAANPQITPAVTLQSIASGFQRACPETFALKPLGSLKVGGHDGFAALAGCGSVKSGAPRSEVALLIAVKGTADMYTIQWAERTAASSTAPVFDEQVWKTRYQQLLPIRLCDKVPGEVLPYPSCINQR